MSLRNHLVLVWVICLSYKVVTSGCEVVLVNRNRIDSFRVGQDGCTNNASVCPSPATCQFDGLCLCSKSPKRPNYRNPVIIFSNGKLFYADTYGCVRNTLISYGIGTLVCLFSPFQEVPYSHNEPRKEFHYEGDHDTVLNCSLKQVLVKFPDNVSEMELQWFDESYVDLNVSNNKMYFKLKRSVPKLQGTIITLNLDCTVDSNPPNSSPREECLRAKFSGRWSADLASVKPEPTVTSTQPKSSQITTKATSPVTTATANPNECVSDSNASNKVLIAVLAIALVVIVVLGIVVGFLWKKMHRMQDNNSQVGEMQNIAEEREAKTGLNEVSPYEVVADNDDYEEPSNYQPLNRINLDLSDENNYQSLTTSKQRE